MDAEIEEKIEEIGRDREHGAGQLSRQAIGVMRLVAERSQVEDVAQFLDELTRAASKLIQIRPAMASITNGVSRFTYEVLGKAEQERDLSSLRSFALSKADELVKNLVEAARKAAENGAELIEAGDRLATCSYSSTVCQAFALAKARGKQIEVIALESGSYGQATAHELRSKGIPVQVIPDTAIEDEIFRANKVFVGADAILFDGSLINGSPSYELSAAAKRANVPFYSLCETTKFDVRRYRGKSLRPERGFDLVPHHLVTAIVTEEGMIEPRGVAQVVRDLAKYVEILPVIGRGNNSS